MERRAIVRSLVVLSLVAAPALAADEEGGGFQWDLYGYFKLDTAFDDSRVNVGNFARWVESETILDDDSQFSMTANQTRVGVRVIGPTGGAITTGGKLEIDFYGGGSSENKANPLLRHAYVSFGWPAKDISILAGQSADVISPLVAPTVNYSAGWWQGNIGYRRPQIRVTKGFDWGQRRLELIVAPTRTISDSIFVSGTVDSGADAAVPTLQGRVALTLPAGESGKATLGISGHRGREDEHITDLMGTIIGHREVDSSSLNLDLRVPIGRSVLLQAEWFEGENLYAYLGNIGQKGEVGSSGGWIAATIRHGAKWRWSLGAGIDDPDDADLTDSAARTRNTTLFANVYHDLTPDLSVAFEWMVLETRYLAQADGDAQRQQFAVVYSF